MKRRAVGPSTNRAGEVRSRCKRTFVDRVAFVTSVGFGDGPDSRRRLGLTGARPGTIITDLGILKPDPQTCELRLVRVHPGVTVDVVKAASGWPLIIADEIAETEPPTTDELAVLRRLEGASS